MSVKTTAAIGASVIVMAVGVNQALMPSTRQDIEQQQRQNETEQLADAHERETDRMRDAGNSHLDAELDQKNVPVEPRPGEQPHIRIRLP